MDFNRYLANLPLLHTWDKGATWNTGGFQASELEKMYMFGKQKLPAAPQILETGAGNSTILFLFLAPARLTSIAPDAALFGRIRGYCGQANISTSSLDAVVEGSEWALPRMAEQVLQKAPYLDFALIDGCHNWPWVFMDFFYANFMLKAGGYLMIDDVQLHSVKELARLLMEERDFQLELKLGKSLIFKRTAHRRTLGEWASSPYIVRKTNEYAAAGNQFDV